MSKAPFAGLDRESLICARCGACQAVCPAYAALGWESAGPRGRMELAGRSAREQALTEEASRRVFQCTLCGYCREACPAHIDTGAAWLELRRRIAMAGGLDAWPVAAMGRNLGSARNVTGEPAENRLLWQDSLDEPPAGLNDGAGAPCLLWVGCVGALYPQVQSVPRSTVQLLTKAGMRFATLGSREECCGFPLLGMGRREDAVAAAIANIAAVRASGASTLVTACPSCYHMWRDVYPGLIGEAPPVRIVHASQLLDSLLGSGALRPAALEESVTFHDPCDLGRNSGEYEAPRRVLARIPGLELVEMTDNREHALCCGGGGNLEAVDPGLAAAIASRRLAQALETGAGILATTCQQCKRTLANAARRERARIKVLDLTELLWRTME